MSGATAPPDGIRILLVEDDPDTALFVTTVLRSAGYHVVGTATSGGEAIAATETAVRAAGLNDIGKVTLPIAMLRQSDPLTTDQKRMIQTHPNRGAAILRALNVDERVVDAIHDHHDRIDGHGYYGKSGRDLSWPARILAVAEVYDAMTSSLVMARRERGAALECIRELRGGQLDQDCVDALLDVLKARAVMIGSSGRRN